MLEKVRKTAEEKGFARRDSSEDMDFLLHNTPSPVKLEGSNVTVVNLPLAKQDPTPFDVYQRSTTEFTSLVAPHGVSGVGLGAGFGAKEDKRLSFLRPRKTLQPRGGAELAPRFDENGFPIEPTSTSTDLAKKRLEYMKSFHGTTMSSREHFLLVDLDFEKDSILFGDTREEFERNVGIMKKVVVGYERWEKSDNFYYYATFILKIMTFYVLLETVYQHAELQMLFKNYDAFAVVMEDEIYKLEERRKEDLKVARRDLRDHPPNFAPIVSAMVAEKEKVLDTLKKEREQARENSSREHGDSNGESTPVGSISIQEFYKGDQSKRHPMDTTNDANVKQRAATVEPEPLGEEFQRLLDRQTTGFMPSLQHFLRRIGLLSASRGVLSTEDAKMFAYAASPTTVDAVRRLRRTILPKSDDLTQIVREEMLAHKHQKLGVLPGASGST